MSKGRVQLGREEKMQHKAVQYERAANAGASRWALSTDAADWLRAFGCGL